MMPNPLPKAEPADVESLAKVGPLVKVNGSSETVPPPSVDRILSFGYKDKLVYSRIVTDDYDVSYLSLLRLQER